MSAVSMKQVSQKPAPQRDPKSVGGGQMGFIFPVGDVASNIPDVYSAITETVDEFMGGSVAFAALIERPVPDVSRRLRRAEDSKGEVQRAPVDYVAAIATDVEARLAFVNKLCARWSLKPTEHMRSLTAEEKLRLLAGELPEKRRRQLEREHGLASGSLEP